MHHSDGMLVEDFWGTRHLTTPSSRLQVSPTSTSPRVDEPHFYSILPIKANIRRKQHLSGERASKLRAITSRARGACAFRNVTQRGKVASGSVDRMNKSQHQSRVGQGHRRGFPCLLGV
jgi:hypothetical protein